MENNNFVLFKRQKWEKTNAYSLVSDSLLETIPADVIEVTKKIDPRPYSKLELEELRDKLIEKL